MQHSRSTVHVHRSAARQTPEQAGHEWAVNDPQADEWRRYRPAERARLGRLPPTNRGPVNTRSTKRVLATLAAVAACLPLTACSVDAAGQTAGGASTSAASQSPAPSGTPPVRAIDEDVFRAAIAKLERRYGARVGIVALDTGDNRTLDYRPTERFGFASTAKVLAAAVMLRDTNARQRNTIVHWSAADVASAGYSPVTAGHVADGLTLDQLADAAVRQSDNTAMNLVLKHLGGPAGLTASLRELGDSSTVIADYEPAINRITAHTRANTSTPAAFSTLVSSIVAGKVLGSADTQTLLDWMGGNATGDTLIRAGAPAGWTVADKSGGAGAIRNDIAVVTPPGRAPIILTVFTTLTDTSADYVDSLVEKSAAAAFEALG